MKDIRPDLTRPPFSLENERHFGLVNGIESAGVMTVLSAQTTIGSTPGGRRGGRSAVASIISMTPGAFSATGTRVSGRSSNWFHEQSLAHVAVVGRNVADELRLCRTCVDSTVFVDSLPLSVIGVIESSDRRPEVLDAVVVTHSLGDTLWLPSSSSSQTAELIAKVVPGAAAQVGRQLPGAIDPTQSQRYQAVMPPDPANLRRSVESDITTLFLGMGVVGLVVGSIAIANVVAMSVMQRSGEIALRRAHGARAVHVVAHVVLDATALGLLGGILGAILGGIAATSVSALKAWEPVIDIRMMLAAPVLGALLGMLGGLYPARIAARVEPAQALRR